MASSSPPSSLSLSSSPATTHTQSSNGDSPKQIYAPNPKLLPDPLPPLVPIRSMSHFSTLLTITSASTPVPDPHDISSPIPQSHLASHSAYISRLQIPFRARQKELTLNGHRPETLAIFLSYVSGSLADAKDLPTVTTKVYEDAAIRAEEYETRFRALMECHLLGWRLGAEGFVNAVMDLLLSDLRSYQFEELGGVLGLSKENVEILWDGDRKWDGMMMEVMIESAFLIEEKVLEKWFKGHRVEEFEVNGEVVGFGSEEMLEFKRRVDGRRRLKIIKGEEGGRGILGHWDCAYHIHENGGMCMLTS